jgi:hypothetical protein
VVKLQEERSLAQAQVVEISRKLIACQAELKGERKIVDVAWNFIPRDKHDDYVHEWPQAQVEWSPSSPAPRRYHKYHSGASINANISEQPVGAEGTSPIMSFAESSF